uniref:Disease resistance protein RGA3 n=1 Tax=Triticum urartu TaxID=4572 RepID=A0A8R7RBW3_TRIUA
MAMVLDAFASYLGDLLKQAAEEELGMMLGVSGDIDKMGVKLGDLKNLLADAERRRITDDGVQQWVTELKRAMYEATDILDLCRFKAMERGSSPPDMGCCNPLLFCLRNPRFSLEIGGRIKKLNLTLDSIKERSADFSFLNLGYYEDRMMARPIASYRKTNAVLEQSGVVGDQIEEDTRALVEKLANKNDTADVMVVAVVGVGGIGKITLAKKVFNDEAIQRWFNTKIWLSVTEFSEAELLKTAIITAKGKLPDGGAQDKSLLVPALAVAIRDKKFFLVLDDMWGDNEWNNFLKDPFSYGAPGIRVLVTTRHGTVARGLKALHPYHHVDKLTEDAWSLLTKQV